MVGGRLCWLLSAGPISAGPQLPERGVREAWEGKSCRAWLWAGLACQLQEASVVFHNQQACSLGHGLPSLLAPHIPLHTQAAKWHSPPCWGGWGGREAGTQTHGKSRRYGTATITQTQRDNTDPEEANRPRHKQDSRRNTPTLPGMQTFLRVTCKWDCHTEVFCPYTDTQRHIHTRRLMCTLSRHPSIDPFLPLISHTAIWVKHCSREGRKSLSSLRPGAR